MKSHFAHRNENRKCGSYKTIFKCEFLTLSADSCVWSIWNWNRIIIIIINCCSVNKQRSDYGHLQNIFDDARIKKIRRFNLNHLSYWWEGTEIAICDRKSWRVEKPNLSNDLDWKQPPRECRFDSTDFLIQFRYKSSVWLTIGSLRRVWVIM